MQKSIPMIAPGAELRLIQVFRESIESHLRDIERAESLQAQLDEDVVHGLTHRDCELLSDALSMLIRDKEDAIRSLEGGIEELEKVS